MKTWKKYVKIAIQKLAVITLKDKSYYHIETSQLILKNWLVSAWRLFYSLIV